MKAGLGMVVVLCFASLFLLCYSPALFEGRQFGFRDAGHYYYPLHQRVQEEWSQGRWPLWEPEENAGTPLLGNPTAAVLYPGKLVFAVLPYAWGARIYIVMHTVLAFVGMVVLLRSFGTSVSGSGLGALAFAFGAPILFQYCNVIYLVGAAWMPLGMHAIDRWVRLGRRWGLCELALVLAMQILGGDPQAAYLLGLSGAAYALGLAWALARSNATSQVTASAPRARGVPSKFVRILTLIAIILLWAAATVALGILLPKLRHRQLGLPAPPLWWMPWMPFGVGVAWGAAALGFLYFYCWRRRGWRKPLGAMWLGLVLAAALAAGLTAAQLFPVIEFTQQTTRTGAAGAHGIYAFSIEPYRLAELVWPDIGGMQLGENSYWPNVVRIPGVHPRIWVPSLYLGGITLVLALSALNFRQGPPWRVWLSAIAVVSSLGALGQYTSPIWATRTAAAMVHSAQFERLTAGLGPLGAPGDSPIRQDGFLKDGDGSIYWWMATFLPGFRQFRYPPKLFSLTSLALAALAGTGWDLLRGGNARSAIGATGFLVALSLCILAAVFVERAPIVAAFESYEGTAETGPLDATKAFAAIVRSLVHCVLVLGMGLLLFILAPARPRIAGACALILTTLDLAAANSRYVMTVAQSLFDGKPELVKIIEKAEAERNPSVPGPFRVHRMHAWNPVIWNVTRSKDREAEIVVWERDTIGSKYGINFGIEYTQVAGAAELSDYEWYFAGARRMPSSPEIASWLGTKLWAPVIYFPRRAYDMWNTRYFIVPAFANGWGDETRASATFRFESDLVYPSGDRFGGPGGKEESKRWLDTQDFEVLRNAQELPRAWVVHSARAIRPIDEKPARDIRDSLRNEILYSGDLFWNEPALTLFDPRAVAWVDEADLARIAPGLRGQAPSKSELVKISYPSPQRAVLDVTLQSSGLVVLSDVYYPGWQLRIDDVEAPILRVNLAMRGALVSPGKHRLEYTYAPLSFQLGLIGSILGAGAWLALGVFCVLRPVHPGLVAGDELEQVRQAGPSTE